MPESIEPWVPPAAVMAGSAVAAWIVHFVCFFVAARITKRTPTVADSAAVRRTRAPARLAMVIAALRLALPVLPLEEAARDGVQHALALGLIVSLTWLVVRAISVVDDVILSRFPVDVRDNLVARRVHTQTRVLTRTAMLLVGALGVAAALMTFPMVRQFGASLLASAGIAGLVAGLAARPVLGNLIAGLQIALSQPIRIDDVVIVEGEWGRIEEITSTYVVVGIWDERRLIVPLSHFIERPFQNWTRTTADLIGSVLVHADYTVPVAAVREELRRIVESADGWDGRVCSLQVTDATDRAVQLRALVSAGDSSSAWDLRCLVREKLIEFLQREHPACLPRTRAAVDVAGSPPGG